RFINTDKAPAYGRALALLKREGRCPSDVEHRQIKYRNGFAPIFPDTCYHLTHYWPAAADIPVASDNPVHYAGA
ncbi:transposase, partial [Salmonella enterica subsp. enterica serovar Enteritidis]|nr:transposase [Salmonella enterica subsp. enterica serovar Enteritidis]